MLKEQVTWFWKYFYACFPLGQAKIINQFSLCNWHTSLAASTADFFYFKSYVHKQSYDYDDRRALKVNKQLGFQAAENAEAGNPQLDEEKGETDDEYLNEEEGYSTEG